MTVLDEVQFELDAVKTHIRTSENLLEKIREPHRTLAKLQVSLSDMEDEG